MKTSIYISILIIALSAFVFSCENPEEEALIITGEVTSNTDCKNITKDTEYNDSVSCIEYSYNSNDNTLSLKHINAGFNCCPGDLYCETAVSNDTISIHEFESAADCDCNCLYDMDILISNIRKTQYTIKITEPYIGSQEELILEIDLSESETGSFCVERTQYPWGN